MKRKSEGTCENVNFIKRPRVRLHQPEIGNAVLITLSLCSSLEPVPINGHARRSGSSRILSASPLANELRTTVRRSG